MQFSVQLDELTEELKQTIATNRVDITTSIENIEKGTEHLTQLLADLQAGRGLAGSLLKETTLATSGTSGHPG
jgi:hypothetical protein